MTNEEKLVEECAHAMVESYGIEADAPSLGRDGKARAAIENRKIELRAVIPLIQADLLREMMEPSEEMIEVGSVGYEPNPKEQWPGMLRAFAKAKGIEIE